MSTTLTIVSSASAPSDSVPEPRARKRRLECEQTPVIYIDFKALWEDARPNLKSARPEAALLFRHGERQLLLTVMLGLEANPPAIRRSTPDCDPTGCSFCHGGEFPNCNEKHNVIPDYHDDLCVQTHWFLSERMFTHCLSRLVHLHELVSVDVNIRVLVSIPVSKWKSAPHEYAIGPDADWLDGELAKKSDSMQTWWGHHWQTVLDDEHGPELQLHKLKLVKGEDDDSDTLWMT